ncbi:ComEC/Rec2 family competence protein [Nocardioides dongxiaopingii]|uniref:ComEC/Rec2 family competence protein n=1 Tax=Nocardioides dongxiaopingii TaxID=2576036 RepID=UPI001FE7DA01|nr:ComEC/Rec2 family competence protein [Nocardioides dongxiaopingii]
MPDLDEEGPAVAAPADLRTPCLAASGWAGGLAAALLPPGLAVAVVLAAVVAGVVLAVVRRDRGAVGAVLACGMVAVAVLTSASLRAEAVRTSPVTALAEQRAAVEVTGVVVADPRPVAGPFGDGVVVRLEVHTVVGRGVRHEVAVPVLVLGDERWAGVELGAGVATRGLLTPADGADLAALLTGASAPVVRHRPDVWWRGAGAVRASIRDAVAHRPADQRALVPALVDGDDAGLAADLEDDFRTTGLTHLTAVSGTNLTLVVGFLLVLARWCHVRGRWLGLVAALGIAGFVLLARTEPSVLRAAAMGAVGLLAMGANSRRRAFRGLGVAVVVLLLVQPGLATSAGFVLSVLATAGIVVLAPGWRDALARWLPRWLAEAVAVPAAAQVACTPVVAGLSAQVSLVAVVANLLVAPVVGPATVLGLGGGLVALVSDPLGRLLGTAAGWCVGWVVAVARRGADLPLAAVDWGADAWSLAVLVAVCAALAASAPWVLRHPARALPVAVVLVVVVAVPLPSPGWPVAGWVLAMCDVGQGDALVLNAGGGRGVVVDAGPDPAAVDRCLDRLDVEEVPLVVLTHFHADHVDGLPGVLDGRRVGQVWTTSLLDPPEAVADVVHAARGAGVVPTLPPPGPVTVGDAVLRVLWPLPGPPRYGPGDGSTANDESLVLLAEVGGVSILLTGDVEPPGQAAVARELPGLDVDVLKLPHHGSRHQDLGWLASLRPEQVLVSVGADNDYGHPAPDVLAALEAAGASVSRTDEDGDVLVLTGDDGDDDGGGTVGVRAGG